MPRGRKTPTLRATEKRRVFIEALGISANVTQSCRVAKLDRNTAYDWRGNDAEFSLAWDRAVELGTDALEDEAVRRGMKGFKKPVFQGGKLIGHVTEHSDTLLIFMLKARRPMVFRDRADLNVTGHLTLEQLVAGAKKPEEAK